MTWWKNGWAKLSVCTKDWKGERDQAKKERRQPHWMKPKLAGIEAPILQPKKPTDDEEGEDSNRSGEDDDEMINGDGND